MIRTVNLDTDIPANRELRIVLPPEFPEGPARIVLQVTTSPETAAQATLGSLAHSEFFGMWRERSDIRDSSEFAAKLRFDGWKRFGE